MNSKLGLLALSSVLFLASCGGNTPVQPGPGTGTGTGNTPAPKPGTVTKTPGAVQPLAAPTSAYYVRADGTQVALTQADIDNAGNRFVFYAWLENEANTAIPAERIAAGQNFAFTDLTPAQTVDERTEVAPIASQNVMAGYVGYRASDGNVYPVVGAQVRWDIYRPEETDVRFATADDGGAPTGAAKPLDVNDNATSAFTYTNDADMRNAAFPNSRNFPQYNVTGVNSPNVDGFTWAAVWLPSQQPGDRASTQITAVAMIGETEIDKTTLAKFFAPTANLEIEKTVIDADGANNDGSLGLNEDATIRVTVRNTGSGPATGVRLEDRLTGAGAAAYSIGLPTGGTAAQANDGFDATFDLAAGESRVFEFPARASATGVYCDMATIRQFTNGQFGLVTPNGLMDDACITVTAPQLNIVKSLVDAQGNPISGNRQVGPNQEVFARITVSNSGTATATNVVVTDQLTQGSAAAYRITQPATGTTAQGDDGFTTAPFTLAPGQERFFQFAASANADGTYCDQGLISGTYNNGGTFQGGSGEVCFTVTSPRLAITKQNYNAAGTVEDPQNLFPGSNYLSVIRVSNTGSGVASNVNIQDILGRLGTTNNYAQFQSGTYTITGTTQPGSVAATGNTVNVLPANLTLAAGQTLELRITSTIPAGAPAGQYCNVASFTSTNGGNGQATDCVGVENFVSEQIQLVDSFDPLQAGGNGTVYTGSFHVEQGSNEGATNNSITFYIGTGEATQETAGNFNFNNVTVRYDPTPARDASGAVIFNPANSTAIDPGRYTTVLTGRGLLNVDFDDDVVFVPGSVLYVQFQAGADATTAAGTYYTNVRWANQGANSGRTLRPFSSEPTTVIGR
ncbi:hypothetical protein QOL99_05535 [Deinococcus sp. MIMF12]|uniref:DUF11 domain-containing protein n=1 Tax=Deinococcus rhizophilus TaxID=3049544 RepID=A0ABT7JEX4_9DEIO|nr:hypothetical protein [Deinococcus rhizophilus]MDL2343611.1 hypothetical protein [Deinococcus rhizophilus]